MGTGAPLDGIVVLDLASVGPAVRASRALADFGATVVKVAPMPRSGVQITPPAYAYSGGRGLKRIHVDMKSDGGREAFLRLAEDADVLIESFRPGVVDRLGIGYDTVRDRNPAIVYCSTSGYGQDGPHAQWAGHDLNYLAVGGFLHCSGRRADGGPPIPGATVADSAGGGMHAVTSILAALVGREHSGEGCHLDVAAADGVLSLMSLYVDEYLATGAEPGPGHYILTGRYACYDSYECADGGWVTVAAIEPAFWANLCRLLDLERWAAHQTDDAVQDDIRADLRDVFRTRDRDDWVALLAPADTCVAPVLDVAEVTRDPQFRHRGLFVEATHPDAGTFEQVAPPLAGMAAGDPSHPVELRRGDVTDTDALLSECGYTPAEIAALREEGAVQ